MERKEFLLSCGWGAGSLIISCCLGGCTKSGGDGGNDNSGPPPGPPPKVDFTFDTTTDANLSARGWTIRNNVIIAKDGSQYLAFEGLCPHQSFSLTFDGNTKTFPCSNTALDHGSVFDATGKRIAGPAPRDLKRYQTQITGTNLRVFE